MEMIRIAQDMEQLASCDPDAPVPQDYKMWQIPRECHDLVVSRAYRAAIEKLVREIAREARTPETEQFAKYIKLCVAPKLLGEK